MPFKLPSLRPSFSAKILIPVLALLVFLPALMLLVVHRSSLDQLEKEARHQLRTADAVFQNSLQLRSRQLLARYHHLVDDSSFKAVSQLHDPATMTHELSTRLERLDGDADVLVFLDERGFPFASAQRDTHLRLIEFEKSIFQIVDRALLGQPSFTLVPVEAAVFSAIAVPVIVSEKLNGVLVIGTRITVSTLKELTSLVGSDGVFVANSNIAASTLTKSEIQASALPHWNSGPNPGFSHLQPVIIDGVHYLALASRFPGAPPDADLGYVLLLSYETALQQLRQTEATLWLISAIGLLLSTGAIWIIIGRITAPLRELRSVAEAVGNGDYTRKVQVPSSDELGQLAYAFNHMTKNIRHSHAELQRTVQTLKATQAQLIQSEKLSAVGEFVAGVAHELNNPLTSVIGFAELLKQADLHPKHRGYLQYIVKSTERCHKIVQGLLSFARQHPPERVLINVNDMVGDVLEILAYEMRTSNIEIEREFDTKVPKILGDSHQLQQVILNILNNARQAIETHSPNGRIRISTEATASHVRIIFDDNGPGITAENLNKIFDPFFTTKPIGKGTGLGLSLCYGIVREHGGTISAHSPAGRGATFVIELPAQKAPDSDKPGQDPSSALSLKGAGKRVLVIDDEEWILELVRQILEQDGFDVDLANDGETALGHVSRAKYQMLVCDWKMPGLSGTQLYERIAQAAPDAAQRLMFMTGDVVSDSFQDFLKQHAKTCLSKPFSVQEFRSSVDTFLRAIPAERRELVCN
jgi:two-component system, NtrC family, sensor kinase